GDPVRDRGGCIPVPDGEALRQLAGGVPASAPEQRDDEEARPSEGEEPGGDRATDGGAGGGANPVPTGAVLPSDQEPYRWSGSGHGDRPQAGRAGVPDAQVRDRVREAVDGGIRGEAACPVGAPVEGEGDEDGL